MENTKSGNGIPFLFFVAFLFCFGLTFAAKEKEPVVEKGRIERRNGFGNKKRTADGSPIERSPESSVSDVEHPCQDARHRSVMSETVALLWEDESLVGGWNIERKGLVMRIPRRFFRMSAIISKIPSIPHLGTVSVVFVCKLFPFKSSRRWGRKINKKKSPGQPRFSTRTASFGEDARHPTVKGEFMEPGRAICESAESPVHFFSVAVFFLNVFAKKKYWRFLFFSFFFFIFFLFCGQRRRHFVRWPGPVTGKDRLGCTELLPGFYFILVSSGTSLDPTIWNPLGLARGLPILRGFTVFFPTFTGFYLVFSGFTEFYWVLPSLT